jgi:hypothetical protein
MKLIKENTEDNKDVSDRRKALKEKYREEA